MASEKFDATVDLALRLGVDPRKADQMVRGFHVLAHGTGKIIRILALCPADRHEEAKKAGADFVGLEDYLEKIKQGWTDIDLVVTTPETMPKVAALGKILGPRGLMPNPRSATVSANLTEMIQQARAGKVSYRVDKGGIIHASVGRTSFKTGMLVENIQGFVHSVEGHKPASAKGAFLRSLHLSTTMSPSVQVDTRAF